MSEYLNYYPEFLKGIGMTLQLTFLASLFGLILALPMAFGALSKRYWLRAPIDAFSYFFRGTPLLVQIYLLYFGSAQFPVLREYPFIWDILKQPFGCALMAFTLNTAAYSIEIFKGAFKSTPKGEIEAAIAIGMSKMTILWRIILPSGFRRALPAYSNEVIFMLHGTAQASVITLLDILQVSKNLIKLTGDNFMPYLIAAFIYLTITFILIFIFKQCEKKWLGYLKY